MLKRVEYFLSSNVYFKTFSQLDSKMGANIINLNL
jgi:hypothetical protein